MVDESEETPATTTRPIESNNCKTRKLRQTRIATKLGLLDAGNDCIMTGEEVKELRCRVLDSVTVPGNNSFGGRRRRTTTMSLSCLRSRVWVNAPDEEEDEDEKSRESFGVDGERDEPVEEVRRRHQTGLMPPREKGAVGRVGCDFEYPEG